MSKTAHNTRARYPDIEDHGLIGDLRTTALVCLDGAIDFLCWPHFDSPSVFASLLDTDRGGRFKLSPIDEPNRRQQMYLPETNVLLTRFLSHDGVAEIVDFMPPAPEFETQALIRIVRGVRGKVRFRLALDPRFDYARAAVALERDGERDIIMTPSHDPDTSLRLRAPVSVDIDDDPNPRLSAEFTVSSGDEVAFVLEPAGVGDDSPYAGADAANDAMERTVAFWHKWSSNIKYRGRWAEVVMRSALVLKLLTAHEHGAIIAAPTFSLPERIAGMGNWDYRYCWIRDTAFAMEALTRLGLRDDALALAHWLEERCCEDPGSPAPIAVLYTAAGHRLEGEEELDSLEGYRGTGPVRVGNGALDQLQLDISGEFINALYTYDERGTSLPMSTWATIINLLDKLALDWAKPDHGIWERRGPPRERLHSRVMSWVAFDRAIRWARGNGRPAPIERWQQIRDDIHRDIWAKFWDPDWGAFRGAADQRSLDAAALVMPLLGFLSAEDPLWTQTIATIDEHLIEDSLVYRFTPEADADDQGPPGTFSLCTFWYVECMSHGEHLYEARDSFERMLRHANHLGLYAEQLSPSGEHLGNFPQAFTHIGLINAAVDLNARLDAASAEPRRIRPGGPERRSRS